eukprot:819266-Rhodomonas_salina.1
MCGTDIGCGTPRCTERTWAIEWNGMCGTEIGYAATDSPAVSSRNSLGGSYRPTPRDAVPGTDAAYAPTIRHTDVPY